MFERNDLEALKKDIKANSKEMARIEAKITKEKAKQEAMAAKEAKKIAAQAKKEAEQAAKEKAKQEAMAAKEAKEAAALAKKEAEQTAKEKAKQEALAAKEAKEAAALAKKEATKAAQEKAKQEAMAAKEAKKIAALAKKKAEKAAKEKAKQEALAAKEAKEAAVLAKKEVKQVTKEKMKQEAIAANKVKEALALAKKEAEQAAKEKAKQEAMAAKEAKEAAALAKKEAEQAAKERAKQEALEVKKVKAAAALAEKEARKAVNEGSREGNEQQTLDDKPIPAVQPVKVKKESFAMVPIFSRRSVLMITMGLVVGLVLGLGYWMISPSLSTSDDTGSGTNAQAQISFLDKIVGVPEDSQYQSVVKVQVLDSGSEQVNMKNLQYMGEYYAAKASGIPFFEFLSDDLADKAPEYSATAEDLQQRIMIRYDWKTDYPGLEVKAVGRSKQEAGFLAEFVPQAFQDYLNVQQQEVQNQEYQNTLVSIEATKMAIMEAQQKLNSIKLQGVDSQLLNDPAYIALNAKIEALESQLQSQAGEVATLVYKDNTSDNQTLQRTYEELLQEANNVSTQLFAVEQRLQAMEIQKAKNNPNNDLNNNPEYVTLTAEITALEAELDAKMNGDEENRGLIEMIADGDIYSPEYKITLSRINRISDALVDARERINELQEQTNMVSGSLMDEVDYQQAKTEAYFLNAKLTALRDKMTTIAQQSVDGMNPPDPMTDFEKTSMALAAAKQEMEIIVNQINGNNLSQEMDRQHVQGQIDHLNIQLARYTEKATSLLSDDPDQDAYRLVAGSPSIPTPVLPERTRSRNALMMGAIAGVGGAWVLLNRKWIAKGMPSSSKKSEPEDDEGYEA